MRVFGYNSSEFTGDDARLIQECLFSIGYEWKVSGKKVGYLNSMIYMWDDKTISCTAVTNALDEESINDITNTLKEILGYDK